MNLLIEKAMRTAYIGCQVLEIGCHRYATLGCRPPGPKNLGADIYLAVREDLGGEVFHDSNQMNRKINNAVW